ncbi:MAG: squalene synthase HpnC [Planctomycetaceae bacterium]
MSDFHRALREWGPDSLERSPLEPAAAERFCRSTARSHYENFPVATLLLPAALRQHFYNVYAFCRWADDLADETGDRVRALQLLAWWRSELASCFAGTPQHPIFVALAGTITEFDMPRAPFEDLISAFEQDQRVARYDTYAELLAYCRRSANPVGRLVLHLFRQSKPEDHACSDQICTGLQLANFWQDVSRDYDIGRVYLPLEDRMHFGYSDADLAARRTNSEFVALMEFQVRRARGLLQAGLPLADRFPGRFQGTVELFASGGLKILDRIERSGYRVWDNRPRIGKRDVFGIFIRVLLRSIGRKLKLIPARRMEPAAEVLP